MGLLCFKCNKTVFGGSSELVQHYRLVHALIEGGLFKCPSVPCNQRGCYITFQYTWSLKRHLNTEHIAQFDLNQVQPIPNDGNDEINDVPDPDSDQDSEEGLDVPNLQIHVGGGTPEMNDIKIKCAQLVCNLRSSSSITTSTVNLVTDLTTDLFTDVMEYVRFKTNSLTASLGVDPQNEPQLQSLLDDLKELETPFSNIDTEYKFLKFLKDSNKYVQPVSIPLGVEYVQTTNPITGEVQQKPIQKTFQYVPIRCVLKLVLESPGVLETIFEHHHRQTENGLLVDFQDGEYCKHHNFFSHHTIRILLYIDDVEVTNPLGGKAGTHKLGFIYYTIKSLPSKFLSSLNQCFLLGVYKSVDAKHYGLETIIRQIVDDLKVLEVDGVDVNTSVYSGKLRAALAQVVGDNLGVYGVLGFTESFSANYACRHCKVHKTVLRTRCVADRDLERNEQNYEEDVALNSLPDTGIKESILNELQAFHVTNNDAPDIMHDLLEGVCAWELKLVIRELIRTGKFTLAILNDRLTSYDYEHDLEQTMS